MSDLIDRLFESEAANALTNEAANEIQRLQEVVLRLDEQRTTLIEKVTSDGETIALANKFLAQFREMARQL